MRRSSHEVIKLLLADHKLIRKLMDQVKSQKATARQKKASFAKLTATVKSHVSAEESALLSLIEDHPRLEDMVSEGYEEHRVHEVILKGIKSLRDEDRKLNQMSIYCEILEHHLDEEEKDLFPRFRKLTAQSTRKKIGKNFLKIRKKKNLLKQNRGAMRYSH